MPMGFFWMFFFAAAAVAVPVCLSISQLCVEHNDCCSGFCDGTRCNWQESPLAVSDSCTGRAHCVVATPHMSCSVCCPVGRSALCSEIDGCACKLWRGSVNFAEAPAASVRCGSFNVSSSCAGGAIATCDHKSCGCRCWSGTE